MNDPFKLANCICGKEPPNAEADPMIVVATLLECLACGRVVGGLNEGEAGRMWNRAMRKEAKP